MRDLIELSPAVVIGIGGGRGAAKSSGADRVCVAMMYEHNGISICLVMRTWVKQMVPFHLEQIKKHFPWLSDSLKVSPPAVLRIKQSTMEFKYAENYDAVEEAFRSGNYDLIVVDQAEQFTEREIREMRKAARSTGKRTAKTVLLFNMRGSGIQYLRKWFKLKEFNKDENPADYAFLKVNPWDNIEWVRRPLEHDGYTEQDYYRWTDDQRRDYAATRGEYTRQLATDDEVIRAADWYGGWDSIEGAYFAESFDLEATRLGSASVESLRRPWATHWFSQDWGKAHWCVTYWHFRVTLSPADALKLLNWKLANPINVIVTYREMIVSEMTSGEVARKIIESTPVEERPKHKSYYLSPECVTEDANCVGSQQGKELRGFGLPWPTKADNDRIGGASLMAKLLKATKDKGIDPDGLQHNDVWFISSECVELLKAIPMLMRDPKDLDDVLKTDKSQAKLEQDIYDTARYGLKSMLAPKKKTAEDEYREQLVVAPPADKLMMIYRHQQQQIAKKSKYQKLPPSWRANIG